MTNFPEMKENEFATFKYVKETVLGSSWPISLASALDEGVCYYGLPPRWEMRIMLWL